MNARNKIVKELILSDVTAANVLFYLIDVI